MDIWLDSEPSFATAHGFPANTAVPLIPRIWVYDVSIRRCPRRVRRRCELVQRYRTRVSKAVLIKWFLRPWKSKAKMDQMGPPEESRDAQQSSQRQRKDQTEECQSFAQQNPCVWSMSEGYDERRSQRFQTTTYILFTVQSNNTKLSSRKESATYSWRRWFFDISQSYWRVDVVMTQIDLPLGAFWSISIDCASQSCANIVWESIWRNQDSPFQSFEAK